VTEDFASYLVAPSATADKPLPRRVGTRSMIPSTWVGRSLRVEYVGADGKAATASGVLLDWCPSGVILSLAGARTIVCWDRLTLVELVGN
jgi:hypothetical protein